MISDTLHDAAVDIQRYLDDPDYSDCYSEIRPRIERLLREMRYVQWMLDSGVDTLPGQDTLWNAEAMGIKAALFVSAGNDHDAWIAATAAAHWANLALGANAGKTGPCERSHRR